mmetsp:Transcript_64361/g.88395  ORF Transcript_64361/g.88395 Transcript_64361/m.88395 type:complete len:449 (-) Transcript_64361:2009-3355(-)
MSFLCCASSPSIITIIITGLSLILFHLHSFPPCFRLRPAFVFILRPPTPPNQRCLRIVGSVRPRRPLDVRPRRPQPPDRQGLRRVRELDLGVRPLRRDFFPFVVADVQPRLPPLPAALAEDFVLSLPVPVHQDRFRRRVQVDGAPVGDVVGRVVLFGEEAGILEGFLPLLLLLGRRAREADRPVALVADPEGFPLDLVELVVRVLSLEFEGERLEGVNALHLELLPGEANLALVSPGFVDERLNDLPELHAFACLGEPPPDDVPARGVQSDGAELLRVLFRVVTDVLVQLVQDAGELVDEVRPRPSQGPRGQDVRELVDEPGPVVVEELVPEGLRGDPLVHVVRVVGGPVDVLPPGDVEVVFFLQGGVPSGVLVLDAPEIALDGQVFQEPVDEDATADNEGDEREGSLVREHVVVPLDHDLHREHEEEDAHRVDGHHHVVLGREAHLV